jgi:hypothetical protein
VSILYLLLYLLPAILPVESSKRVRKVFAELEQFSLASSDQTIDSIGDLMLLARGFSPAGKR